MSYSFSVTAADRAEAQEKIAAQFDAVVSNQPEHAADRDAAETAVMAFVDLLTEPSEDQQIAVSVSGYLSWRETGKYQSANVSVNANLVSKA